MTRARGRRFAGEGDGRPSHHAIPNIFSRESTCMTPVAPTPSGFVISLLEIAHGSAS